MQSLPILFVVGIKVGLAEILKDALVNQHT